MSCHCRTTSVNFNTPPLTMTCTFDARLVSKTLKDQQSQWFWDVTKTTLCSPTQDETREDTLKFRLTSHLAQSVTRSWTLQVFQLIPTPTNPVRQLGHMHFVQSIQCVNCMSTQHSQVLKYVRIRQIRQRAVQVIAKVRSVSVHSVTHCTLLVSLLPSPVMVQSS